MTPFAGFQFGRAQNCLGALAHLRLKVMLLASVAACLLGGASAGAQQYPLRAPQGTSTQPQRGTSAPSRVEAPDVRYPANPLYSPYPIAHTYIPAIVMSDGTIWANFGYGYVRVHTSCRQPRVFDSRGLQATRGRERAQTPCYARNSYGSFVVVR